MRKSLDRTAPSLFSQMIHVSGQSILWQGRMGCLRAKDIPEKYFFRFVAPYPREINIFSEQSGKWLKFKLEFPNNRPIFSCVREGMLPITIFIASDKQAENWEKECKRLARIVDGF